MAQTSPATVKVKGISQVAFAVKDVQRTIENFWNILGIGPWDIYEWGFPQIYEFKYHLKPAWAKHFFALAQVGAVQLELVQYVDGDSIFQDFLREHGEGLHHLQFRVDNIDDRDKTMETLAKEGFPSLQSVRHGEEGALDYVDTKPLRAIWEVARPPTRRGIEPIRYPDTARTSPARVKATVVNQVAIVVRDLEMVAQNYWNILGIGPWAIYAWESPEVYERKYRGKPTWAKEKIAVAQAGPVQLKLCQPIDGDSIYQDFLEEHGEGIHHLSFVVDNVDKVDETAEILVGEGFPSIQSGRTGVDGAFNYIDIKPLHAIWEVVRPPTKSIIKPTCYPEDSA